MDYLWQVDIKIIIKLFPFRQTFIFSVIMLMAFGANAQLVDGIIGQRRDLVHVYLRPYRIIDYKMERMVVNVDKGIHQTALFENDTCTRFYWAVTPESIQNFKVMLLESGYSINSSGDGFVKDSLELTIKPLDSGKATLYIASISSGLKGKREVSGKPAKVKKVVEVQAMPLLQQAILEAEKDTTAKPPKDPKRHWIGGKYGSANLLGY
ncbi:MAG: hypothetical protein K9J17_12755 [Flavobacteriales bacterium]|nr:hypothetical protein [Flavobacteriales bacterium]